MKAGDLVKVKNDPDTWCGHGVILNISKNGSQALIRWFDQFADKPVDISATWMLEVISESG